MNDNDSCRAITPDGVCNAYAIYLIKHDELEYRLCTYHRQLFRGRGELRVSRHNQPAQDERAGHTKAPRRRRP